ncbi:MAG: ChaN family lipoprotein [Acidaminococcales bacterium]|nr:ChaN family lipoprotein [Acidaminococcales bacterium]
MKKLLWATLAFLLAAPPLAAEAAAGVSWHLPAGSGIALKEAVKRLKGYDVVMFGEYHDQNALHQEQLAFLKEYCRIQDGNVALSLEMIEKDVAAQLKKYIDGAISEEEFIKSSRPWKNYREAYAPLVEFAKARGLDVIAANIPRRIASQYARTGSLDAVDAKDRVYLPRRHWADKDRYWEEFSSVMNGAGGEARAMSLPKEKIWDFYRAQCLKDDVMAQSIADYLALNPTRKVLQLQGTFHGRLHLGVADKLQRLVPGLKIAVISPVFMEENAQKDALAAEHEKEGDLLLLVKKERPKS